MISHYNFLLINLKSLSFATGLLNFHKVWNPCLKIGLSSQCIWLKWKAFKFLKGSIFLFHGLHWQLPEFLVEISQSKISFDFWLVQGLISLVVDVFPVDIVEPGMVLDLLNSLRAESLLRVLDQKSLYEFLCWVWQVGRVWWLIVLDLLEQLSPVVCVEWRYSNQHFIYDVSKSPPVNNFSIRLLEQYFWGKVLRCSANSGCFVELDVHSRETKVCYLYVAVWAYENVLWLEVSIYDFFGVQVL